MKKIIIIFVFLATIPSIAFGGNAAPYTEDALQKIINSMHDTPKALHDGNLSKEEFIKQSVEYFSKIFEKAGYSFNDTIDKIVDDMKNNPEAIPSDRQSIYNNVYVLLNIMMYECNYDNADCLQFFPSNTKKSLQWFMDNSEFSKKDNVRHMGSK